MPVKPMPQNKQIELPTGIKYIRVVSLIEAIFGVLALILFIILISYSTIAGAISSIILLIILVPFLLIFVAITLLIFKGLGKRKYWGWMLALIFFAISAVSSLITLDFLSILLPALFLWYLYKRYGFYKTGKLVKDDNFFRDEKIFKYLFWIIILALIIGLVFIIVSQYNDNPKAPISAGDIKIDRDNSPQSGNVRCLDDPKGFMPNQVFYPEFYERDNPIHKTKIPHRTIYKCEDDSIIDGPQVIDVETFNGGYCNYICKSRYEEHCLKDGSFDQYYDEWCEDREGNRIEV